MTRILTAAVAAAILAGAPAAAQAEPLKIGMVVTLTGPGAVLGEHIRNGFQLALDQKGGRLGGMETELTVVDDELKPDVALTKTQALLERDDVDIIAGVVFSNIMNTIFRPVTESETFLVSANAGPSTVAGRACSPFFFSTSWQNDQNHELLGQYATDAGYERVFLMAPNYQAGRDSLAGFKRYYEGEIADEVYTQLGQLDFAAELARIAAAQPDAVFTFMPGGMGVNLVKQYRQAGLADTTPFLSAFTVDETTLPATRADALGFKSGAQWAPDLDVPANAAFVQAYMDTYDHVPSLYASQGYDAALLIDAAVAAVGGDLSDTEALQQAFHTAEFDSVRGDFEFNVNGFPIQDFYLVEAVQREDGSFATSVVQTVFEDHGDAYAEACGLTWD